MYVVKQSLNCGVLEYPVCIEINLCDGVGVNNPCKLVPPPHRDFTQKNCIANSFPNPRPTPNSHLGKGIAVAEDQPEYHAPRPKFLMRTVKKILSFVHV